MIVQSAGAVDQNIEEILERCFKEPSAKDVFDAAKHAEFFTRYFEHEAQAKERKNIARMYKKVIQSQSKNTYPLLISALKEYLKDNGITNFTHITQKIDGETTRFSGITQGLGTLTGWWEEKKPNQKTRRILVAKQVILARLGDYETEQRDILIKAIKSQNRVAQDYLQKEVVGPNAASENYITVYF